MSLVASMTGFASVSGSLAEGRGFVLTAKGVNHRHLDLQIRLPAGCDALEPALRAAVKTKVRRGHVELSMTMDKASTTHAIELDESLLGAYLIAFRQVAEQLAVEQAPDINALLRHPGVMSAPAGLFDVSAHASSVLATLEDVLCEFNATRVAEGEALRAELRAGMGRLRALQEEARSLREAVAGAELTRLKERLQLLLRGTEVSEERLLAEAALTVARGDVEEELVRLETHVERFVQVLDAGGEVGRQLDFLLQELNREANTMLSKTGGVAGLRLTELGLEMKVELERAREQVQNLE